MLKHPRLKSPAKPKRITTATEDAAVWDAEYTAFCDAWTEIARWDDGRVTPNPIAIMLAEANRVTVRAVAVDVKHVMRAKGTKNSAVKRRAKIAERNKGWRDSGKTAKQIFLDQPKGPKGRWKKNKKSVSQITRVLKARTP